MPRDGSGNFSLPEAPFQNDTVADPSAMNSQLNDIAAALTASLVKDGQTAATADLPMGTNKHTNVGNAAARNQYAAAGQVQDDSIKNLGSVSGTDTVTGSLTPAITAYATGMMVVFKPAGANTGATTIAINGLAAKSITKLGATALAAGDLASGVPALIIYDGAAFQLLNPQTIANDAITNAKLANMAQTTVKGRTAGAGTGDPVDLTAAQLVDIIETADGTGSGLDADTVDGSHASAFAAASHSHAIGDLTNFAAGTYTPTDSANANLDSCTPGLHLYIRVGGIVIVFGSATVDVTTGGSNAAFEIDLPIASNLAATTDVKGHGSVTAAGIGATEGGLSVDGVVANDTARIVFLTDDTGSAGVHYSFAYRVL